MDFDFFLLLNVFRGWEVLEGEFGLWFLRMVFKFVELILFGILREMLIFRLFFRYFGVEV